MKDKRVSSRVFALWALISGVEGFLAALLVARDSSETGNALVFGLSLVRLMVVTGTLLFASFFILVAAAHFYGRLSWDEQFHARPKLIRYFSVGLIVLDLLALHLLLFVPSYRYPTLSGSLFQLRPLLVWMALIFTQSLVLTFYYRGRSFENLHGWLEKPVWVAFAVIGLLWGAIALTRVGVIPDEWFWNVAGVPILAGQVWLAIGVTLFAWFLYGKIIHGKDISLAVLFALFIGIWTVTAIVWIKTPLGPSFNAPGPYLPSKGFYPFVDAALFDLGAQSAIYGKGFFFGTFLDRGLLPGFLALIHRTFGQNYLVVVGVQSAVYAVFPALLFLLGKKVHSASAGVMVAALSILKVSNAIMGGKWVSTSHPKLMLTEFPTGITLVFFSFFFVKWLREKDSRIYNLVGVGAAIGLGILLRQTVLFMFPVLFVMGFAVWGLRWKPALRDVLIVVLSFFITISPWMWRNQRIAGQPLFFLPHLNEVMEERYQTESSTGQNRVVSNALSRELRARVVNSSQEADNSFNLAQYQFIPKHFIHNLITSVLVLPPSPVLDDFRHVVYEYPYWGLVENSSLGDISFSTGIFLAINLFILSIGIGKAWRRVKFAALVPLMVFLFYNLASAFGRTSGGRYIVPVDWVVYFYYAIGLVEIIQLGLRLFGFRTNGFFDTLAIKNAGGMERPSLRKVGLVVLPFFFIVAMLPAIEFASLRETAPLPTQTLLKQLEDYSFFEQSGLSRQEMDQFLATPGAVLLSGRGFYPRYYSFEQGEPILPGQMTVYTPREYPRLVFSLLLENGDRSVLLPIDDRKLDFPDAAKVIVGGCQVGDETTFASYFNYIDAAFVVVLDNDKAIYTRVPDAPLTCPLREPVCDNNHDCQ